MYNQLLCSFLLRNRMSVQGPATTPKRPTPPSPTRSASPRSCSSSRASSARRAASALRQLEGARREGGGGRLRVLEQHGWAVSHDIPLSAGEQDHRGNAELHMVFLVRGHGRISRAFARLFRSQLGASCGNENDTVEQKDHRNRQQVEFYLIARN